jgi:putative heme-binding domain-containing protein
MPAFAGYGRQQIAGLVKYLRTLQGANKDVRLPGNPALGQALFFGKAGCSDCHMIGGQGGYYGQDLTRYAGKRGVEEVRSAIANPNKDLDPRRGLVTVVLADSTQLTGLARNEDNFSMQLQTQDGAFHLLNKAEIRTQAYEGKSPMPADYAAKLSPGELNDLVSFLIRTANIDKGKQANHGDEDWDE